MLFLEKDTKEFIFQVFIEPKGKHLQEYDGWKEEFLKTINSNYCNLAITALKIREYKLKGIPFYNSENQNCFKKKFNNLSKESIKI